jgi:hypothetical protein
MMEDEKKQNNNFQIVGINLAILAGYTILSALTQGGPFIDAFFLGIHVITCLILSMIKQKWVWALSALVVLLIGVSTCVGILFNIQGGINFH